MKGEFIATQSFHGIPLAVWEHTGYLKSFLRDIINANIENGTSVKVSTKDGYFLKEYKF